LGRLPPAFAPPVRRPRLDGVVPLRGRALGGRAVGVFAAPIIPGPGLGGDARLGEMFSRSAPPAPAPKHRGQASAALSLGTPRPDVFWTGGKRRRNHSRPSGPPRPHPSGAPSGPQKHTAPRFCLIRMLGHGPKLRRRSLGSSRGPSRPGPGISSPTSPRGKHPGPYPRRGPRKPVPLANPDPSSSKQKRRQQAADPGPPSGRPSSSPMGPGPMAPGPGGPVNQGEARRQKKAPQLAGSAEVAARESCPGARATRFG